MYRDDLGETTFHEPAGRQHADRAEHDPSTKNQAFVLIYRALEISGFDRVLPDDRIQMLVPLMFQSLDESTTVYSKVTRDLPVEMKILRDEEPEFKETAINQFLRDVLDCDIRLCDNPDCIGWVLSDLALNRSCDHGGLPCPRWPLMLIVR